MDPSRVSILIPAYNEEQALGSVLDSLISIYPESEIIVVDDGSTDSTSTIARKRSVRLITHRRNCGYGAALKDGIRIATREYILCCDADGQHTPFDVGRLMTAAPGFDMVVGARSQQSHQPFLRRPGKFVLRWFANSLAGEIIPDLNSGLRLFRRTVILRYLHLMPDGFSFSTTSTFAMLKSKRQISWVPIVVQKRVGTSTVRQLRHGPQTLMLLLRLSILFEPLKLFLAVSGLLGFLAALSFSLDLLSTTGLLFGDGGIADTTVLLSAATVTVFMSGLLCDQVSALRRQQHEHWEGETPALQTEDQVPHAANVQHE